MPFLYNLVITIINYLFDFLLKLESSSVSPVAVISVTEGLFIDLNQCYCSNA